MQEKVKIALVMDNYKINAKEFWWERGLKTRPEIKKDYVLEREEIFKDVPFTGVTTITRYYKLKTGNEK